MRPKALVDLKTFKAMFCASLKDKQYNKLFSLDFFGRWPPNDAATKNQYLAMPRMEANGKLSQMAASSRSFFLSDILDQVGRTNGLIERKRILTADRLVTTLSFWKDYNLGHNNITSETSLKYGVDVTKTAAPGKAG